MQPSRLALFGHPIAHSLSPRIHAAFAQQTGIAVDYVATDVTAEQFPAALAAFAAKQGRGANVTLPLKQAAYALCDHYSARAEQSGAVNTLIWENGHVHGDNTDGIGLVRDLTQRHGMVLKGAEVLLLGAGGAARGVAFALLGAGINRLVIANRSLSRANALAEVLNTWNLHLVVVVPWEEQGQWPRRADFVINATSASRSMNHSFVLPPRCVSSKTTVIDLNYGASAMPFLQWAHDCGVQRVLNGLGMLVEQAAESFALWHGIHPETERIYAQLRNGGF